MTLNPYYYDELPITGMDEEILATVMAILMGVVGVVLLLSLIFWIICALSLQAIARRRGIRKAWLAWVPIGTDWILGSISDQYQHLIQGKITARRKLLLGLTFGSFVMGVVNSLSGVLTDMMAHTEQELMLWGILTLLFSVLALGVNIAALVFYHMSNYDLYRSCNPKNAVTFLVLGIIFPITQPFFYLSCRKKDLGMVVPEIVTAPAEIPMTSPEF